MIEATFSKDLRSIKRQSSIRRTFSQNNKAAAIEEHLIGDEEADESKLSINLDF